MATLTTRRPRLSISLLFLALGLVLAPVSAFAQNYIFDSAGVYARALASADGVGAPAYTVSEQCTPGCTGGKLSSSGFKDTGTAVKNAPNGDAGSMGSSTNSTTATTDANKGVSLSISSKGHAQALALAAGGWAASPFPYKGPDTPWFDGTNMYMAWKVNTDSTLKVNNLKGVIDPTINGGQYFATASWTITVTTQCCGIVIATYDEETNGSTFNATIPGNTVVRISWSATAGAKTAFGPGPTSAVVDVSVTGSLTIGP